jgi:hypothetical protein
VNEVEKTKIYWAYYHKLEMKFEKNILPGTRPFIGAYSMGRRYASTPNVRAEDVQ